MDIIIDKKNNTYSLKYRLRYILKWNYSNIYVHIINTILIFRSIIISIRNLINSINRFRNYINF